MKNQKQGEGSAAKIIKAASVYTGIILGAGFASGQELIQFFVRHGARGIGGLVLAGFLFSLTGWAVMDICARLRLKSHEAFIRAVFGKPLGLMVDSLAAVFIGILFCAMLAGTGAMAREAFDLSFTAGVAVIAAICFVTFLFDLKGIIQINVILAPLLVIGGVFFGLYSFITEYTPVFLHEDGPLGTMLSGWVFAAITYSSYNIVTAVNVLSDMPEIITSRKIARYAGLLGGGCLTLLGLCFALPLFLHQESTSHLEIPMLAIAGKHGLLMEYLYIFLLLAAILTTAVSNGFAIIEWIAAKTKIPKLWIKASVVLGAAGLAHMGFSQFVRGIYPIFGYVGLFQILVIIGYFLAGPKK